jgi:hypothetical protein
MRKIRARARRQRLRRRKLRSLLEAKHRRATEAGVEGKVSRMAGVYDAADLAPATQKTLCCCLLLAAGIPTIIGSHA